VNPVELSVNQIPRTAADEGQSLRQAGAILLISCYELGHQPIGLAQPVAFLEQAGYAPAGLDIAVEEFDAERVRRARFVGISVPMHTALRLGARAAELIREINPASHICFFGLYASINAEYLLQHAADSVIGGEYEIPLVNLVEAIERRGSLDPAAGDTGPVFGALEGVNTRGRRTDPVLKRPPSNFPAPAGGRIRSSSVPRRISRLLAAPGCPRSIATPASNTTARCTWSDMSRPAAGACTTASTAPSSRYTRAGSSSSRQRPSWKISGGRFGPVRPTLLSATPTF